MELCARWWRVSKEAFYAKRQYFIFRFFTQDDLLARVPLIFFVLSGTYVAMQIIGCILLMDPPEKAVYFGDTYCKFFETVISIYLARNRRSFQPTAPQRRWRRKSGYNRKECFNTTGIRRLCLPESCAQNRYILVHMVDHAG